MKKKKKAFVKGPTLRLVPGKLARAEGEGGARARAAPAAAHTKDERGEPMIAEEPTHEAQGHGRLMQLLGLRPARHPGRSERSIALDVEVMQRRSGEDRRHQQLSQVWLPPCRAGFRLGRDDVIRAYSGSGGAGCTASTGHHPRTRSQCRWRRGRRVRRKGGA